MTNLQLLRFTQVMVHLNHDACAYSTCIMNTSDILTYTNILKQYKIKNLSCKLAFSWPKI